MFKLGQIWFILLWYDHHVYSH